MPAINSNRVNEMPYTAIFYLFSPYFCPDKVNEKRAEAIDGKGWYCDSCQRFKISACEKASVVIER